MAKDKSFAAKVARSTHITVRRCAVCGEVMTFIHRVEAVPRPNKNSYGFKEGQVAVCKCNTKQLIG
jgi:hypothetical protein